MSEIINSLVQLLIVQILNLELPSLEIYFC